jgi:RNA polymerase sigma-70 factor (ECF subfamily)
LIRRIADHDQAAMTQFYDETSGIVYALACRMLGNVPDAEEVTVDVYSQIWRTADRYTAERGTVFAWVVNMARSRAVDRLRARRSSEPLPEVVRDERAGPEKLSELSQQRERVRSALSALPAEQRTAIELAFFSGMSHSELAAHLGEPLGTIKTRVRSGMLKLRSALGELV